jgi:SP family sugar:H+ symporter-like MFS transporter
VFAGCIGFAVFFVWFFVHETKNLTLEQINEMFASGVSPWGSLNWQPSEHLQPSANNGDDKAGAEAPALKEHTLQSV